MVQTLAEGKHSSGLGYVRAALIKDLTKYELPVIVSAFVLRLHNSYNIYCYHNINVHIAEKYFNCNKLYSV